MKYNSKEIDISSIDGITDLYFVGDIHGEFEKFGYNIKTNIKNSIIVVAGDVGIGFHKPGYYEQQFSKLHEILKNINCYVIFMRGNHDDPKWFSHTHMFSQQITHELSRIILVDDYDLVKTQFGHILFIGGAVSIDRTRREINSEWWQDEFIKPLDIDTFNRLHKHNVDIVVSHSAPDFCFPHTSGSTLDTFANHDKYIKLDCRLEREMLSNIYEHLSKSFYITNWYYGHFHDSYYDIHTNYLDRETKFHGLNCNEFKLYNIKFE